MKLYIKYENESAIGDPITEENLRQLFPSIKDGLLSIVDVSPLGYFPYLGSKPPVSISPTEEYIKADAIKFEECFKQAWVLSETSFDTIEDKNNYILEFNRGVLLSKLSKLKNNFLNASERPKVDTGLGFFVDGSHADLQNFKLGQDLGLLTMIDSEGTLQVVTIEDYDTVLSAIQVANLELMQTKWDTKALLQAVDLQSPTALAILDAIELPFQNSNISKA